MTPRPVKPCRVCGTESTRQVCSDECNKVWNRWQRRRHPEINEAQRAAIVAEMREALAELREARQNAESDR